MTPPQKMTPPPRQWEIHLSHTLHKTVAFHPDRLKPRVLLVLTPCTDVPQIAK